MLIDALLGVGIEGCPREPIKTIIHMMNETHLPIISVDVPSGFTCENTRDRVNADYVVTFHAPKKGMEYIDKEKIVVKSIGIPSDAITFVGPGDVRYYWKLNKKDSHKGENGRVLIIGGSKHYFGAPVFSAEAAFLSGVDLVYWLIPSEIKHVLVGHENLIPLIYEGSHLNENAIEVVTPLLDKVDVILIGPGLGLTNEVYNTLVDLLSVIKKDTKLVIDADGLKHLKDDHDLLHDFQVILTPHHGEFKLFFGENPSNLSLDSIMELVRRYNMTLILKGHKSLITDGRKFKYNTVGDPRMTMGGTGDVLAGIVSAAFTKMNAFNAATAAIFLNGVSALMAKQDLGPTYSTVHLLERVPLAIRECLAGKLDLLRRLIFNE